MPTEVSWVGSTCIIIYCACDMDFALWFLQLKVCSLQFCFQFVIFKLDLSFTVHFEI